MSQAQLSSTNIQITSTSLQELAPAMLEKQNKFNIGLPQQVQTSANTQIFSNVVSFSSYGLHEKHPLAPFAGILADNPLCDEYLEILGIIE